MGIFKMDGAPERSGIKQKIVRAGSTLGEMVRAAGLEPAQGLHLERF